MRNRDLASYPLAAAAALLAFGVAELLGLEGVERYICAFVFLTVTVPVLLAWSEWPAPEFASSAPRTPPAEPAAPADSAASTGVLVTRAALGLTRAEARTAEPETELPMLWVPSASAQRRVGLRADGSALVVGAHAESPDARFAAVALPELRTLYVLLHAGERGPGRSGRLIVPNLARDFVDQAVSTRWLGGIDALPADDARAIAASVAAANHFARAEWRREAEALPPGHPVRTAVLGATG